MLKPKYVIHYCKNPDCNNSWVDVDLTNAKNRPPSWKYCKECCEKYGYVNPETPPHRKNYEARLEQIEKHEFQAKKTDDNEGKLSA